MLKKLLLLILLPWLAFGQKQPKVGLVLSGGGAKGFAHVGVLKELEKAGVQIDYIGGTSMGSIIGGMYAAGYSPNQIEVFIKNADFNALVQDKIPRREKTFFEKTYVEKHTFSLPLEKGKIHLPLGLSKGQNTLNLLTEIFSPVDNVTDFSKLPIPFYCVATDLETGKEVVLEKGSIPLAIRASSSFPTLLNPVEVDGKLLVDGGVVNNFPVDLMRTKDVDIVIGVDVQGKLSEKENLTSVDEIIKQIINFQMYRETDKQIDLVNIYIKPKVTDYSVTSFGKKQEIVDYGSREARKFSKAFENIAKQQTNKRKHTEARLKTNKFLVDRIVINGNKNYSNNYILGKLQLVEGDSVSYADISKKINTLSATNNFERIDYYLTNSFSGKKLTLIVKEEKIQSFLRLGLHYDMLYETSVLLSYNHKKILLTNDEISIDAVFGDDLRYELQYFIDNGIIPSYGLSSRYNSFAYDFDVELSDINKLNINFTDFTNKVYTQTTLDKKFALGFGLEHKKISIKTETISVNNRPTYFEDSNYINSFAFLKLDTFDKAMFPNDGLYVDLGFKWYIISDRNNILDNLSSGSQGFNQFSQLSGTISNAFTLRKKLTFQYTIEGGYTVGEENTQVFDYFLGGYNKNYINNFKSFYGYEIASLNNQSFLKVALDLRYEIFKKHYISAFSNLARIEENAYALERPLSDLKSGYAIGYGLESFLGPIELKYSWSPDHNEGQVLFNLGFWF